MANSAISSKRSYLKAQPDSKEGQSSTSSEESTKRPKLKSPSGELKEMSKELKNFNKDFDKQAEALQNYEKAFQSLYRNNVEETKTSLKSIETVKKERESFKEKYLGSCEINKELQTKNDQLVEDEKETFNELVNLQTKNVDLRMSLNEATKKNTQLQNKVEVMVKRCKVLEESKYTFGDKYKDKAPKAFTGHALKFNSWWSSFEKEAQHKDNKLDFFLNKLDKQSLIGICTYLDPHGDVSAYQKLLSKFFSREDVLLGDVKRRIDETQVVTGLADELHLWKSFKSQLEVIRDLLPSSLVHKHQKSIVQRFLGRVLPVMGHSEQFQLETFSSLFMFIEKQINVIRDGQLKSSN